LGLVVIKLGIIVIEEIEFFVSLRSIEKLDISIEVEELEFSNNERL